MSGMGLHGEEQPLVFRRADDARRGGFMHDYRPHPSGETAVLVPVGRTRTADDDRAFRKRVAKRRARKGYR